MDQLFGRGDGGGVWGSEEGSTRAGTEGKTGFLNDEDGCIATRR